MPLTKIETLVHEGAWALWHITETKEQLWPMLNTTNRCVEEYRGISHPEKRLEWLASRLLIQNLARIYQVPYHGLYKDDFGKPHLNDSTWQISLAHCFPFAVGAINKQGAIGIDIEKPRDQLRTISSRFLNDAERQHAQDSLELFCHYWTGKEALYKIYGRKNLIFKENIKLYPHENEASQYRGEIVTEAETLMYDIHYQIFRGHMIAYSREI